MATTCSLIDIGAGTGCDELARRWNELWMTSTSRLPLSSWEQLELWQSVFAAGQKLEALIVERDGRWVAGLPLIRKRVKGFLPVRDVPYNDWTGSLELLVAHDVATDPRVCDELVAGLKSLRAPLCWIAHCATSSSPIDGFVQSLARKKLCVDLAPRHEVGVIDFVGPNAPASWEAYQAAWSGNFRRQMRKMARRAEELGGVELVVHRPNSDAEVATLMHQGFAIEDRSWKGRDGTSVLRSPGMLEYFTRQAQLVARRNELLLLFLKHGADLIAFEYGWSCRRVYYSPKVGFDESFSHLSPGQMLRYLWVERLFADQTHDQFDFAGPLSEATEKWATSRYALVRLLAGTSSFGNMLIRAAQTAIALRSGAKSWSASLQQQLKNLRRPPATETALKL